jgi:hypothetical protein
MRTFSQITICISILVGLCSVLALFRQDLFNLATTTIIATSCSVHKLMFAANNSTNTNTMSSTTAAAGTKLLPRLIRQSVLAVEQSEVAGARVRRSIGVPSLRNFSPFLMLDHFSVPKGAGFPDRTF